VLSGNVPLFPVRSHACIVSVETLFAPGRARIRSFRTAKVRNARVGEHRNGVKVRLDGRPYRGSPHTGAAFRLNGFELPGISKARAKCA
jgi:hypothetical protein